MAQTKQKQNEIIIPAITDYFADKDKKWLNNKKEDIKEAAQFNNWWDNNIEFIEENLVKKPAILRRDLSEMGYERVQRVKNPGEFKHIGEMMEIFPLCYKEIFKIEFNKDKIEKITSKEPEKEDFKNQINKKIANSFLDKVEKGDYIVHVDHGIGIYEGKKEIEGSNYYILKYAKGDKLMVPSNMKDRLSPYIGFSKPRVYKLGGSAWLNTKKEVKKETVKLAKELLNIYGQRELIERKPYEKDGELEKQFAQEFKHKLTIDQEEALKEIKDDMENSTTPMDRVLCADVGFGKTELALRACFKAIANNKQAAFMTPTTILADQHYQRHKDRFEKFGINTAILTRFQSEKEKKEIYKGLKNGDIDFVIGTHALLSDKVKFEDLGLLIIDEEQKFGVKQKEKFKENYPKTDILSLSATPIPRTFKMSLSGLKDISTIFTPPPRKKPIDTTVDEFEIEKVKDILEGELERDGQVYYLVPKIEKLKNVYKSLSNMLPDTDIKKLHGKMSENKILENIREFQNNNSDLLLATTIIENGLDLENVNLMVVEDAQKLGLAQAHQIRGRVGRKEKKASAYFFFDESKITEKGKKRLKALERFQSLGDSYWIALKDMEIRGAGNLLGKEQAGNVSAVGLNLFTEMLNEAINMIKEKGKFDFDEYNQE